MNERSTQGDKARLPNWNLAADTPLGAAVASACAEVLDRLRAGSPQARRAFLCDTRSVHREVFAQYAPPDLPEAAGQYRGTPGGPLATARRAVFSARRVAGLKVRDMCTEPAEVHAEMSALAERLEALWGNPPVEQARFDALADVTARFLRTHPYLDGNGHIYRMMAVILADHLGLTTAPDWRPAPRPYDHHMSLCLQWYPHHPLLLSCYLRQWFG